MKVDECPCRYCVPPKRNSTCHAVCGDYLKWNKKHQERLEMIRENKKVDKTFQSMKYATLSSYKKRTNKK